MKNIKKKFQDDARTQAECHDRLVQDDRDEDGDERGALLLQPYSQTLHVTKIIRDGTSVSDLDPHGSA